MKNKKTVKNLIIPKQRKKLVNVMRRKRFPFMDIFAQDVKGTRGFGHSRGVSA